MDGKNYSAVPPPPSLTNSSKGAAPLDFNDALSKARAIAEKLKQQSSGASEPTTSSAAPYSSSSSGTKRGYNDDDREDYRSSSGTQSYGSGSYQDDRESKRSAYDSGSSRPSYGNTESRRYGLGSEERKPSYGHSYGGGGSSAHQEEYSVPSHMVGLLIGKGGENLKKIERMSGVSKVQFSNDTSGPERQVHLTGEPDQISIARDMIRQMVEDAKNNESNRYGGSSGGERPNNYSGGGGGGGGAPHQRGGHTDSVKIPLQKVGLVIGRGGETIRDFEERSTARIMIQSDAAGDSNERTINIVGEESAVKHAKSLIEDIVFGNNNALPSRNWGNQQHQPYGNGGDNYGQQQQSHGYPPNSSYGMNRMGRPDDERIFVKVPSSAVGLIIGRGGENVKALQDQSGARVKVDPSTDPNSDERTVNISGDPKCVAIAKQLVEEKVQEAAARGDRHGGGYNNDRYSRGGGYKSHQNQDYNQQSGYGAEGGYDYSQQQQQYNQYYAQYGYGQNQYGQAGQDSSNAYQGYPYSVAYGAEQAEGDSSAPPPPPSSSDENGKPSDESNKDNSAQMDPSAYYAQYYANQQQMTPEQQQAYYQWYQQYYGAQQQQYGAYDQSQQNSDPSQQEQPEQQQNNESSDSNQQPVDDVDGEPIKDNTEGDNANSGEPSKPVQTD